MAQDMSFSNYAYALDVLGFIRDNQDKEPCALVIVTGTDGGGVRATGALMAVTLSGQSAGYVSNGCIDADVILHAQRAMNTQKTMPLRYGKGSPFMDMRLPCGGQLDLLIVPQPDTQVMNDAYQYLSNRQAMTLSFSKNGDVSWQTGNDGHTGWHGDVFQASYIPKPKLRIIGRGTEPLALARLGQASDMDIYLQSPDEQIINRAASLGIEASRIEHGRVSTHADDDWTACVLMFHDHDWEYDILTDALQFGAFYIGALGSRKTHAVRCEILKERGVSAENINRIKAPIGLIPSMRNASMLAISTLADIAAAYQGLEGRE